jgi:phosphatidylserine/phosphatidylglycerophosphate/cardiolipin synthase-like enzyme
MNVSSDYYGKQEDPNDKKAQSTQHSAQQLGMEPKSATTEAAAPSSSSTAATVASSASESAASAPAEEEFVGGTGKFRDTHLRVVGPAVASLERVSLDTFHEAARGLIEEPDLTADRRAATATRLRLLQARGHKVKAAEAAIRKHQTHSKGSWYPRRTLALQQHLQLQQAAAARLAAASACTDSTHAAAAATDPDFCAVPATRAQAATAAAAPSTTLAAMAAADAGNTGGISNNNSHNHTASSNNETSDLFVQVLPSNVWRNLRLIQRALLLTVRSSTRSVRITNPYFFPPPPLFRALQAAARRGVRVEVLMAGAGLTDVPITRWASQHIYHTLLRSGVRIWELQSATLHAKTVVIDSLYSSVGSFNFDRLSARRNLEVNLTVLDPTVAQQLERHFDDDRAQAREITIESLKQRHVGLRLLHRVAYFIMRYI